MRLVIGCLMALGAATAAAPRQQPCPDIGVAVGRWDLTVSAGDSRYPSWLEVARSGSCGLVGRFVGRSGSARPIDRVAVADGMLRFAIPPQWERGGQDLRVEARIEPDRLTGTITTPAGQPHPFAGVRAPRLARSKPPAWGDPVRIFNGRDLTGWTTVPAAAESQWRVEGGVLVNQKSGANLRTTATFEDFALHLEFRYPANGNSGVYLRGRYEVQIEDTPRREWPETTGLGGIYGFLAPSEAAAGAPNTWHSLDVTLVGRTVSVILDGRTIVADGLIPGITGGALDSDEGAPGPLLLQGDHTAVEFRNITVRTPAGSPVHPR